ncbi:SEL1-like repeat protein [Pseudohalioglobus lutimaris]|uniref:Sel1 repeat family protein n=1 Tax=Pseudohalioglobus lutimaris TaxID=1737061 RepID=A0A2N5X145_9GAMM|nr:SEL1-like repeat protein [Pseudohalioglobus lutimaris]PLW68217.1 hypothetical protein C0039_13610 [Pseudohalioglobus lutimaris]
MQYLILLLSLAAVIALILWLRQRQPGEAVRAAEPVQPLHLGIKSYMREDYSRAEPILRHHAEAGELKAQQLLAKMYYSGHGVPQSMELYLQWLERAADQGDRAAKARLKAAKKNRDA